MENKMLKEEDLKNFKALREIFTEEKKRDQDSFATFSSGLRNNWIFVLALFAVGWWVVTNTNESKNINSNQDQALLVIEKSIETLGTDLISLRKEMSDNSKANVETNNEILRRLDLLQKDIEIVKTK